jgi:hypothetical protein
MRKSIETTSIQSTITNDNKDFKSRLNKRIREMESEIKDHSPSTLKKRSLAST